MPFTPPTRPADPDVVIFRSVRTPECPHGFRITADGRRVPLEPLQLSDEGEWKVLTISAAAQLLAAIELLREQLSRTLDGSPERFGLVFTAVATYWILWDLLEEVLR